MTKKSHREPKILRLSDLIKLNVLDAYYLQRGKPVRVLVGVVGDDSPPKEYIASADNIALVVFVEPQLPNNGFYGLRAAPTKRRKPKKGELS